jgi:chloride channel protein, CIC family
VLGITAGLIGVAFQKTLYNGEDAADRVWGRRRAWLRPVTGGALLGLLLLALPQMYGVGYPVMDRVFANHYVLWFVVILLVGKILAVSLTLWIGGSGGVFAPSLFTGAAAGPAFGIIVHHIFGAAVGPPALYGAVAMGGVFAAAAQAPLTSIASVAEMTGNFTLTLPIMLACQTPRVRGRDRRPSPNCALPTTAAADTGPPARGAGLPQRARWAARRR